MGVGVELKSMNDKSRTAWANDNAFTSTDY